MFGIVDITAGQCNLILHRHPLIEKIKINMFKIVDITVSATKF